MGPKVSVLIPVFNHESYIGECVESALNQDYPNLEVVVVDDGSTDRTPEILRGFGRKIRVERQKNAGAAAALNAGIRLAQGSLVAWLSADDLYLPRKITAQVDRFGKEPFPDLVYTDWIMIDGEGREVKTVHAPSPPPERFPRELLNRNFINGSSVLARKECIENVAGFDEALPADVDGDMWFRLLKRGCRFGHVARPLLKYRRHAASLSRNYRLMQACKDRVRLKVLGAFSVDELFGDLIGNGGWDAGRAYTRLALTLAGDLNFRAAEAAVKRACLETGSSLGRTILASGFRAMSRTVSLELMAAVLRASDRFRRVR